MSCIYERLAQDVLISPSNYTLAEVILASGFVVQKTEMKELKERYNKLLDRLIDADRHYERSFQEW